jgi:O-antigen ligase
MFKQRPFTGVGAGGNNFIGYRMANNIDEAGQASPTESHVLYGQVLAEFGVFGAIVFIGFVASLFRCCFFARKCLREKGLIDGFSYKLGGAIIVGLLLLLFLGFAGHNFYRPLWLWAAAWSGSLLLITKRTIQLSVKGE